MDTSTWVFIAIAVLLLLVVLGLFLAKSRKEKTGQFKERYGSEYDRRVEESGSEKEARKHLTEAEQRRERLEIRPLEAAAKARYTQRWEVLQSNFVDRPGSAVDEADSVVTDVMRDRGYPVDDFSTRADMVAIDHPHVVEDYRAATDARRRHHDSGSTASTEELRRAMVHYRSLFERLVSEGSDDTSSATTPEGAGGATAPDDPDRTVDLRSQDDDADTRGKHAR